MKKRLNTITVPIIGMHCRSCELLIEDELKTISGITKAVASQKKACVQIEYNSCHLKVDEINQAIESAGYKIGVAEKAPFFSRNPQNYLDIFSSAIILFFLYIFVDSLGLSKYFSVNPNHPSNLLTVAIIGLTAGFSTCMTLIGGIILGVSARFSQTNLQASAGQKFTPHLFFNLGRIISYAVFGGLIGLLGSFFQFSGFSLGLMTLAVALVMLTLGLQLTGLFPRIKNNGFILPKFISRFLGIKKQNNAFLLGASTFFLPCGFTQAMQLYAVSTGNFVSGAAIMSVFALGTAPGLLSIGGLTAAVKGEFAKKFFKFAGLAVSVLALFNLNNGLNLLGLSPVKTTSDNQIKVNNGVQIVRMDQTAAGYNPNNFTVAVGIPVRWIINSKDPNTCASNLVSAKLEVRQSLHPGENIIEFTPKESGTIRFSCSMGMFTGAFNVVENNNAADLVKAAPGCASGGGCGCGGGTAKPLAKTGTQAAPTAAKEQNGIQVIKTIYTQAQDISPNEFTVKAGQPVRLEIDVKDQSSGCMGTIYIPQLTTTPQVLIKGQTLFFEFTPQTPGNYPITCAMGVPRGQIIVN